MNLKISVPKFYLKLFSIFVFVVYTAILFALRLQGARIDDPISKVENVSIEQRKAFREFAATMKAGLLIKRFGAFEVHRNNFIIDGTLWFEFYGSQLGLDVIEKFSFIGGKILSKSAPDIKLKEDRLVVTYQIVFEVKAELNHRSFPIANHRLVIVLVNHFLTPSEMFFSDLDQANSFIVAENVFQASDWGLHSTAIQPGLVTLGLDSHDKSKREEYPCLAFTINFIKKTFKDLLVLFIPIFAAALFSWLSLLMDISNHVGRFSLSITAVTAILGYRFVIEQASPRIGYFTILDKFYLGFLISSFFVFVYHLIMTSVWYALERKKNEQKATVEAEENITMSASTISMIRDISFVLIGCYTYFVTAYFLFY